ncbi:MAG: glycoside hydrolase family 32 protein [Eubacteriales bacterium]|nr:glycoside hydrolase family 32 protein [Eubacteriales bacterium]
MNKRFNITAQFLYIPVQPGKDHQLVEFFVENDGKENKVLEFLVPINQENTRDYIYAYKAQIPVEEYVGSQMIIKAQAPESFFEEIEIGDDQEAILSRRPVIHMSVDTGWSNDPNGLVYQDGIYHFYYQYNPVNTIWQNMSWGHCVSKDLLHWEQKGIVLLPEEEGTMYSGSGIVNEKGMLGLPEDALIFFYTMAGGVSNWSEGREFTQKIAYSLNGGETLQKIEKPCLDTVAYDNRDPKVFWHEESQAYIMVLWIRGCEYGIFRSNDLENWERTQALFFEDTWECPDLFCLSSETGEKKWFFWTADGFYFPGDFDGYTFKHNGERHKAYIGSIPYAAQTYSNVPDRTISIPWLRLSGDRRPFNGSYGIPMEFTFEKNDQGHLLIQKPVREMFEQMVPVTDQMRRDNHYIYFDTKHTNALIVKMRLRRDQRLPFSWKVNGVEMTYSRESGEIIINNEKFMGGHGHNDIMLIIDDKILEVFFENGKKYGVFETDFIGNSFKISKNMVEWCEFFKLK